MNLIELRNVSKRFGQAVILDQINLNIQAGEITTIIGKSGMGKTVILKHLVGLIAPDSGQILFKGQDITHLRGAQARRTIRQQFGFMFQNVALFDAMTIYDNIALPLRENTRLGEAAIKSKVTHYLQQLEIAAIAHQYPAEISGGMKKRAGLARVLVTEPNIILFDEPTTGLDPIRKYAVHDMIAQMHQQLGFTAVIVSHDIPDIFALSHRVAMLDQGKIIFSGTAEAIQRCTHSAVQSFVHGNTLHKAPISGFDALETLFDQFEICLNTPAPHSLILLKIQSLQQISQQLGYAAKQEFFQQVASILRQAIGHETLMAQYAHNQIIILLPDQPIHQAQMRLNTMQQQLQMRLTLPPPPIAHAPALHCQIYAGSLAITRTLWVMEEAIAALEPKLQPFVQLTTSHC